MGPVPGSNREKKKKILCFNQQPGFSSVCKVRFADSLKAESRSCFKSTFGFVGFGGPVQLLLLCQHQKCCRVHKPCRGSRVEPRCDGTNCGQHLSQVSIWCIEYSPRVQIHHAATHERLGHLQPTTFLCSAAPCPPTCDPHLLSCGSACSELLG